MACDSKASSHLILSTIPFRGSQGTHGQMQITPLDELPVPFVFPM